MHKNVMNVISCFPGAMGERTNEPEEGEIVDDYELISSDEELCMRQRIRELEEENAEIEQIAVISRSYDIDRAARIPTDASSISSTEFKTPKKRKRHKNKEHKKKACHHHHHSTGHHRHHGSTSSHVDKKPTRSRKTRCKRREKLLVKKHSKTSYKDIRYNLTLDSPESLNSSISSSSLTDSDCSPRNISAEDVREENDYYHRPGLRNTLRLAVARSRKNSNRQSGHNVDLKERLLRKDLEFTGNQFSNPTSGNSFHDDNQEDDDDDDVVICEPENEIQCVPDDSTDSLEEKELRLIALKSAVLKKHMERKRRNAEVAYSPTDFDDIISSYVVDAEDKLADLEVVDLDEDDSQNGCITASPIASPQLMMLDGQEDSSQMVDCKPVDMDIADSDSEDAGAGDLKSWNVEMASTIPYPPYPPNDLGNSYPYGLYMPDFNTNSLNPPPPGVDDYEEMKQTLTMNFGKSHDVETQDMDVENDEFEPIETYPTTCKSYNNNRENTNTQELQFNSNSVSVNSNSMDEENQEEEEQALRALLLSKFNSPKSQKKTVSTLASSLEVEKENLLEHQPPQKDASKKTVKPTEAILKEAVKRLKVVGMCKEEYRNESLNIWDQSLVCDNRKDDETLSASWEKQHQQEYINETPLPRVNISLDNNACTKESKKEVTPTTLECLKRKVIELKSHKESNVVESNGATNEESRQSVTAVVSNLSHIEINAATNANKCSSDVHLENVVIETGSIEKETASLTLNIKEETEIGLQSPQQDICTEKSVNTISNLDEDTKRRLQKLKDEIINATLNTNMEAIAEMPNQLSFATTTEDETPKENCTLMSELTTEMIVDTKEEILSNKDTNIKTPKQDCIIDKTSKNKEGKAITICKTITKKANLNDKGTIEVSLNKTALKENNLNKVNKGTLKPSPPDLSVGGSINLDSKKIVRTLNKTTVTIKSKDVKQIPTKNLSTTTAAATQTFVVKPLPTYSVLRSTKIVKPNKVINTNVVDLKRKVVLIKSDQTAAVANPAKIVKTEKSVVATSDKTNKQPADSSRLITSMDQVRHMCNVAQLVISMQNSSNESSEEEWADCDSMYKPLYDYNDIASPLSLHLESPCLTPIRSNSPVDGFEEKTNNLPKTKRSPITFAKETTAPKTPVTPTIQKPLQQLVNTPVAVRHLPSAAQDEYRKLVNRMKLLENQRIKKECISPVNEASSTSKENTEASVSSPAVKPTLVKQVLLRNINNKTNCSATTSSSQEPIPTKPHKANVLRTYESIYAKIGAGIVNNLDKSLCLVEEAKKAKINKLRLETRLKKLKAEMELLQSRHKEEEQKISRIYPSICSTNEVITSMKQKRAKVFKAAINLGKTLKGEDYRLNNELKQSITSKTKKLASEIKTVNSLKAEDIDKLLMEEPKTNVKQIKNAEEKSNCKETFIETETSLKLCTNKKESLQTALKDSKSDAKINDEDDGGPDSNSTPSTGINSDDVGKDEPNPERCSDEAPTSEGRYDDHNTETEGINTKCSVPATGVNTEFQERAMTVDPICAMDALKCERDDKALSEVDEDLMEDKEDNHDTAECDSKVLLTYTSPLEHLRNINGTVDPNGVVCPYDLMGNCEDGSCKYVHISRKDSKDLVGNSDI